MGRFQLGSTVVMCFPDSIEFDDALTPGQKVSMGQSLGMRPSATAPAESEEHAAETAQGTPTTDEK